MNSACTALRSTERRAIPGQSVHGRRGDRLRHGTLADVPQIVEHVVEHWLAVGEERCPVLRIERTVIVQVGVRHGASCGTVIQSAERMIRLGFGSTALFSRMSRCRVTDGRNPLWSDRLGHPVRRRIDRLTEQVIQLGRMMLHVA